MNIRTVASVSAALIVVCGIVATNLWRELHAERELTAGLRIALAEAEDRAASASAPVERSDALQSDAAEKQVVPAAPVSNDGSGESEAGRLQSELVRSAIERSHPGVIEELALNPYEASRLFDLLAQRQMAMTSQQVYTVAEDQESAKAAVEALRQSMQDMQRQHVDTLRKLLGEERYERWLAYQPTRATRIQADNYASTLAQAGAPLDGVQHNALVKALLNEQDSLRQDTVALGRKIDASDPDSQRRAQEALRARRAESTRKVLDNASASLTPQQISLLREQIGRNASSSAGQFARQGMVQ